ncbi:hypothetical protein G7Z17_g2027 [Cylindrodendrum hubeiense]|uniref:Uncharacterized protein n=1 Tax=Cylindrodendrum hubeiense TaxID=595255 RepID=A0A9P5HEW3_9HYPO|nr:hypothetical protein G7Z17_g2027 [Cylindrodendrum hubeiense]
MEKSKDQSGPVGYNSLPIELKTMTIHNAIPDQTLTVTRFGYSVSEVCAAPLLLVNKEISSIAKQKISHVIKVGMCDESTATPLALDMTSCTLKTLSMALPSIWTADCRPSDAPLPFQKMLSVSICPWIFPANQAAQQTSGSTTEQGPLGCKKLMSWPDNAKLPLIKEITFVAKNTDLHQRTDGFFPDNESEYKPRDDPLGTNDNRGMWLGFRYFKASRRVQFTPLTYDDVRYATEEAETMFDGIPPAVPNECPLVMRIWLFENETSARDEPHHLWTDIRKPGPEDPIWASQIFIAWNYARKTWLKPRYCNRKIDLREPCIEPPIVAHPTDMSESREDSGMSRDAAKSLEYEHLPNEVQNLVVKRLVFEETVDLTDGLDLTNGLEGVSNSSTIQSLLRLNKDTNTLVRENLSTAIEISDGNLSKIFYINLDTSPLIINRMCLPSTVEPAQRTIFDWFLDISPLPVKKLVSVWGSATEFEFTKIPLDGRMRGPSVVESWRGNRRLPELKEATFIAKTGGKGLFCIDGYVPENLDYTTDGYALGNNPAKGLWIGFRCFKETGHVQFTPLCIDEVVSAYHAAAPAEIKSKTPNEVGDRDSDLWRAVFDYPVMMRIWIIEAGESPQDQPHHRWTDVRRPTLDDDVWVAQVYSIWESVQTTWLDELFTTYSFPVHEMFVKFTKSLDNSFDRRQNADQE